MSKLIDLNKNVQDLCTQYPELIGIMTDLGFKDITRPITLATIGKVMTIPKGAAIKKISMQNIKETLMQHGFEIADAETERKLLLKSYVSRLTEGEKLETVREDFVKNFADISALEIVQAEQELIKEGTPISDVQNLCDVHSALFHGATQAEKIENAEEAVRMSMSEQNNESVHSAKKAKLVRKTVHPDKLSGLHDAAGFSTSVMKDLERMINEKGHPLWILHRENLAIEDLILKIEADQQLTGSRTNELLQQLRAVASHYGKKDELFFPLLKRKYDVAGPSDVMWGVDDEIRNELKLVSAEPENLQERLQALLKQMREMIYKEENILFPLGAEYFTDAEWFSIRRDIPEFGCCLITAVPEWEKMQIAEREFQKEGNAPDAETKDGVIKLPTGQMSEAQLRAVLNTMPYEITFIDEQNMTRYFNEGEKLFPRPISALGTEVFDCHPPKAKPIVKQLIKDLQEGKRESMEVWMPKNGELTLVRYIAVRDDNRKYMGVLEVVQKMGTIAAHFGK